MVLEQMRNDERKTLNYARPSSHNRWPIALHLFVWGMLAWALVICGVILFGPH